jgi:phosphoribosylanthranilate isomerase
MKIKICGMRDKENIKAIADLHPDFMGFIFYPGSKRFVGDLLDVNQVRHLPASIKKTGVFVNASADEIRNAIEKYNLSAVQLHGDESVEFVIQLYLNNNNPHVKHVKIIKAFAVDAAFDFTITQAYTTFCDYFLFDTKTSGFGGSGQKFDWSLLKQYDQARPFFLSGGLGPEDIAAIRQLKELNLYGIDINSKVETSPGLKDVEKVKTAIRSLKNQ